MLAHDFLRHEEDRTFVPTSSSRSAWYFSFLVVAKLLRCIGIFLVDVLAKSLHVMGLLWIFKIVSSLILLPVHKPFNSGKPIRRSLYVRIGQISLFNCLIEIIWFYGITLCGPLRSVLVFEQSSSVVLAALLAFTKGGSSPSKTRGLISLVVGYLVLMFMDSDSTVELNHSATHAHHSGLNHMFYHIINWFGVSDHKGGVILLIFASLIRIAYDSQFRHLAVEIGGPKRLYSMVNAASAAFLTPLAVLSLVASNAHIESYFNFMALLLLAVCFVVVVDFYAESMCFQHVADPVMAAARWSPITMFWCALTLAWMWYQPSVDAVVVSHALSGGVVVTVISFTIASFVLTSPNTSKSRGGHFVGMSDNGLPLYTYGEAFLQRTSRSMLLFFKETLRDILANSDSRRIFWFLCANLAFCGVEFTYGFLTNSLGLISDGFHMLFDCSALCLGLVASVMSRWPASRRYSYGYGRFEVLSGFVNAMFLIVIALFIFLEAVERLFDPPEVTTDKLMLVAVAGLLVNLFGMYAFHGGDHGHSHGGGDHGHSHHGHSHGGGNANMQGVFLHVLADTLGSVFVIISTLLIQWLGWTWVDPFCSLILSLLILGSVYPLLKASAANLLQDIPPELEHEFEHALDEILHVEGVESYSRAHVWQLKSEMNVASVNVQVAEETNEQTIRAKVEEILKEAGVNQSTVQVEKQSFFNRIQSMCPSYRFPHRVNRGALIHPSKPKPCADSHGHSHSGGHGHSHEGHGHSHNGHSH
uniref:Proton-coupled zinc antiporter SLC30A5 n=1 Tax=Steinernema glaseri TaxID=37863 RepID=A0A1I7YXP8_9BILA